MDFLLRVGPLVLRPTLAVLLGWLLVRHREDLPAAVRKCWLVILIPVTYAAANGVWLEGMRYGFADLPAESAQRRFYASVYHAGYLINGSLAAMLPAALLALLLKGAAVGRVALAVLYVTLGFAVLGIARGSHADWDVLMATASVLELIGLAGWVAFFVAFFLGYLPRVDGYLAAFLGVTAVFVMLTPINETIFRHVGRADAAAVWNTLSVMMLLRYVLQVGIVALLLRTLRRGGALGRSPDPAVAGRRSA